MHQLVPYLLFPSRRITRLNIFSIQLVIKCEIQFEIFGNRKEIAIGGISISGWHEACHYNVLPN